MFQEFKGISIKALSSSVPKRTVGNEAFSHVIEGKELRMFEKTVGILNRRWAEDGVTASDLGYEAARELLEKNNIGKDEINALIFLSQTPDYKLPFTSNLLQHRLGLNREMLCLDINAGCAGFVQGLGTAYSLVSGIPGGKVLFIVAETLSRLLSMNDRGTTMLFGDGASAILIENTGDETQAGFFNYFTDGANADAIIVPDGGYRNEVTAESLVSIADEKGNSRSGVNVKMDGERVFDFTLREIKPSIVQLLERAGMETSEVDYFLFHQSNRFIIRQIAAQLGVSADKALVNIQDFGNTSGVSIPLLMSTHTELFSGRENLVMSGYGSGLNWGNCLLQNNNIAFTPLIEI